MTEDEASLLPMNATKTEQTIERTISRDLELPTKTLWDPQTCPAVLLPWLAWSLSVDQWDTQWPIATQRKVIAESATIHRHKGTVMALKQVLANQGVAVGLTERPNGLPFTFELVAWRDAQVVMDATFYRHLRIAVETVKPVRTRYQLRVGARFGTAMGVATLIQSALIRRFFVTPDVKPVPMQLGLALATQGHAMSVARISMESV